MERIPCYSYEQIQKKQFIKPKKYVEVKADDEFFAILKAGPYIQTHEKCYGYLIHILPDDEGDHICFPVKLVEEIGVKGKGIFTFILDDAIEVIL